MLWCGIVIGRFSLLTVSLLVGACNYPKPPAAWSGVKPAPVVPQPVVVAPPPPAPPPPPPPPPPPKCEDLSENCTASADTKLAIGEQGAWFAPPPGWHFARGRTESVALHPDGTGLIVLAPSSAADIAPAIEALAVQRGITGLKVDKLKRRLKKPQQALPSASGAIDLWEVDKSQQGESLTLGDKGNGTLLVLVARPSPEQTLIGISFVVETAAETEAPKIMQSLQTLRGQP